MIASMLWVYIYSGIRKSWRSRDDIIVIDGDIVDFYYAVFSDVFSYYKVG